ncbi:DUF732 domain-containing protein [Mycobacterium sp. M1]|uniref:DUF732 domain-containing protein n=1 Tax=Mycolicibacter acidiphilus TaxID=2835306 RepID=A0ABS5RJR3_9MYCO|nr:DUF732 domain-containing protein [Mycolicibacter acidiphilus]MBS9533721.1 DUF732 domain-containing protein [Mycolicibacter acidiphilus]
MKFLLSLLGISVVGLAPHAHADPAVDEQAGVDTTVVQDGVFLQSLRAAGISYSDPAQAVTAGRTLCNLADRGEPGLELIADLKANNPGFTTDGAAQFAAIAANTYCNHHLTKK